MATQIYRVQDPNGVVREIEGPAGASEKDVIREAQRLFAAAPPDPGRQMFEQRRQQVGNIVGGAVRGAGSIGSVLTEAARTAAPAAIGGEPTETFLPRVQQRMSDITAALIDIGVDPESAAFQVSKLATEIGGTLGVGPVLGGLARTAGAARVGGALEAGGMGSAGAAGLTGFPAIGTRMAAGGAAGAATTALVEPGEIGTGTAIGAFLPAVPAVYGFGRSVVQPLIQPRQVAENRIVAALGGQEKEAISALRGTRGMPTAAGFQPTLSERLVEGGLPSPTVAAMERRVSRVSDEQNRMVYAAQQERIGALKGQLERINSNLQRQAGVMNPQALADLTATRDSVMRSIQEETAAFDDATRALGEGLANASQIRIGEVLSGAAEASLKKAREEIVTPAYNRAFELAPPSTKINFQGVVNAAREIRAMPLAELKAIAPETAKILDLYGPQPIPATLRGGAKKRAQEAAAKAVPEVTLEQADALNKALNIDLAALSRSSDSTSRIIRSNLMQLKTSLKSAIDSSPLSDEAKKAYEAAKNLHGKEVADKFYSGTASKLQRMSSANVPLLPSERIVRTMLGSETGATDLLAAVGREPATLNAISQGVEDEFRRRVFVKGRIDPNRAAKFLADNQRQLSLMDNAGANITGRLQSVQQEAARIDEGYRALAEEAKQFKQPTAAALVDDLLKNSNKMGVALRRMDAPAREALSANLSERVNAGFRDGNYEDALRLLRDPKTSESMKLGLGAVQYNRLVNQAQIGSEVKKLLASPQLAGIEAKMPTVLTGFTTDQLMNLENVARDVARMRRVEDLGGFGAQTTTPNIAALASEEAAESGVAARATPSILRTAATVARNVWINVEERINKRVAAELSYMMYNNPDGAIEMIRNAQRRAKDARKPGPRARVATTGAIVGGAQMMSPEEPQ
jgi:hypothetical protein